MGKPRGSKGKREYTVSSKALAQRRSNIGILPAETKEELDYNSRLIEHVMRIHEIASKADKNDLLSLKSCFVAYMRLCQEDGFPVQNLAAYSAMGFTNAQFMYFSRKDDPEVREFVSFVKSTCGMFRESMVTANKLNPVIGIFWQRNFDGLRNDTEQVQVAQEQEDNSYTNKNYKDKYLNMVDDD